MSDRFTDVGRIRLFPPGIRPSARHPCGAKGGAARATGRGQEADASASVDGRDRLRHLQRTGPRGDRAQDAGLARARAAGDDGGNAVHGRPADEREEDGLLAVGRGDEFVGHGRTNSENLHDFRWEADEARAIEEVTETFRRHEGKPPQGWMGAGTYENPWTPDLLKEAGYEYLMDWPHDDQPIWMRTRSGPILSVPYPAELNDSPQIIHRQHTGREFCDMLVDQFEEMVEQSAQHPLVCNISIHPFVFGYPFRLRPLRTALKHCFASRFMDRVWKCKPGDVADFCYAMEPGIIPGS